MSDTRKLVPRMFKEARGHYSAGHLAKAEQLYHKIIAIDDRHADSFHGLGEIACSSGLFDLAVKFISQAISLKSDVASYHTSLALILDRMGRLPEAVACYQHALALEPNATATLGKLGIAYGRLGNLAAAATCFDRALTLDPKDADTQYNLGLAFERQGKLAQALAAYEQALALKPDNPETLNSLGTVLFSMRRLEESLARIDQALALRPDYVDALSNRGTALLEAHRPEEALAAYDRALARAPNHVASLSSCGTALMRLGRLDEALVYFERAQTLVPKFAEAHWGESICRLLAGDFERGWEKYEWRWGVKPHLARHFRQPQWHGEDISGKSLLIHAEQGFGDTIQFCRYVPLVAERGARVVFGGPPELGRLLASLAGIAELHLRSDTPPQTDFHSPLLSLPRAFKTTLATVPANVPYLTVPPEALARWRERLADTPRPRIGLVFWSWRLEQLSDRHRAISPDLLTPLLGCGATVVCLQKDYRPQDREWLATHPEVLDFTAEIQDFADTAALASLMDIVVTIDTAVAHLAGALGLPVWIMLSYIGDWRWMRGREDSPWYPTARLYRQTVVNDWTDVIKRVGADLRSHFSSNTA